MRRRFSQCHGLIDFAIMKETAKLDFIPEKCDDFKTLVIEIHS